MCKVLGQLFGHWSLHWRHSDHDDVSNHQPHGCLLNRLFRRRSKKTSKLRVTGFFVWNSPGPVNSPHKGPVTRKMFPFDDVIMVTKFFPGPYFLKLSLKMPYNDIIKWKYFPHYWPFVRESTGHRWVPLTKANDTELWCFLWSAPEQMAEQTIETPLIWDAIVLIMTSL